MYVFRIDEWMNECIDLSLRLLGVSLTIYLSCGLLYVCASSYMHMYTRGWMEWEEAVKQRERERCTCMKERGRRRRESWPPPPYPFIHTYMHRRGGGTDLTPRASSPCLSYFLPSCLSFSLPGLRLTTNWLTLSLVMSLLLLLLSLNEWSCMYVYRHKWAWGGI